MTTEDSVSISQQPPPRRPWEVTVTFRLTVVHALVLVGFAAWVVSEASDSALTNVVVPGSLVQSVLEVVLAVYIFKGRAWARTLFFVLTAFETLMTVVLAARIGIAGLGGITILKLGYFWGCVDLLIRPNSKAYFLLPIQTIKSEARGPVCSSCGKPIKPDTESCEHCGALTF